MAIGFCTSCASGNLATQYAEQLSERVRADRRADPNNPAIFNRQIDAPGSAQSSTSTFNTLGESIGVLVNKVA